MNNRPHSMSRAASLGLPIAILVLLVIAWETVVRLASVPQYLVPAPSQILEVMWARRATLVPAFGVTLLEAVLGFLLANTAAVVLVIAFFYSRAAERSVFPLLVGLKSIPIVAMAPLLVLWLGYGLTSKVVMAAIVAFFPMVIGLYTGVRSISSDSSDLMRSLTASRWEILVKLCLPTAVPHLLAALKVSATLAVVGAIVAELMGAKRGLGFTILMASYNVDTPLLFSAIGLSAVTGGTLVAIVTLLERQLWRYRLDKADAVAAE